MCTLQTGGTEQPRQRLSSHIATIDMSSLQLTSDLIMDACLRSCSAHRGVRWRTLNLELKVQTSHAPHKQMGKFATPPATIFKLRGQGTHASCRRSKTRAVCKHEQYHYWAMTLVTERRLTHTRSREGLCKNITRSAQHKAAKRLSVHAD